MKWYFCREIIIIIRRSWKCKIEFKSEKREVEISGERWNYPWCL